MSAAEAAIGDAEVAADLMLREPKTLPGTATVADVREQLANPKVQLVLLADAGTYRGAVTAVPNDASPDDEAVAYADPSAETIPPTEPALATFERANASPHRRVIVVGEGDALLGLVCLNHNRTGFCQTPSRS
jgi:CBS domain-containing protein